MPVNQPYVFGCWYGYDQDCSTVTIFRSGSVKDVNSKLKFLSPENPESTIKRAAVPTIIPKPAIRVITLMALVLLLENK